jgi:hypothetical protein
LLLQTCLRSGGVPRYLGPRLEWQLKAKFQDDYEIARLLARMGSDLKAMDSLERAYANRNPALLYIRREPTSIILQKSRDGKR